MTISTIVYPDAPTDGMKNDRFSGGKREQMDNEREYAARIRVSGQAIALFEAGQDGHLEVFRDRVRQGYYQQKHILDHLVDCLAHDIGAHGKE